MSGDGEAEMTGEKTHEQEVNTPNAPGATTPEPEINPAVANFRQGILTKSQYELLLALGEEPREHQQSAHLQSMEDSYLRRMWRLINAFGKVQEGVLQKKDVIKDTNEPGMCMKTNKSRTKCTTKIRTFTSNRHEFCREKRLCDGNILRLVPFLRHRESMICRAVRKARGPQIAKRKEPHPSKANRTRPYCCWLIGGRMTSPSKLLSELRGNLIVSCQAEEGSAFRDSASMAHFARAAVQGGAAGIRANGREDVLAIRQAVSVPIIGICKVQQDDGKVLITPTFEGARQLVGAGAGLVALDCTLRGQRYGALERLRRIKAELGVPVLADIATLDEAVDAAKAGADAVLSTLRGYTEETQQVVAFEPRFIAELARAVDVPVIAEGRIHSPQQVRAALEAGAYALVVGTAITRPESITRAFVAATEGWRRQNNPQRVCVGIDMGGSRTKYGLVTGQGELLFSSATPTPWNKGRNALLKHLRQTVSTCLEEARRLAVTPDAIGLATAGWVDPQTGRVEYATENLPGWTGANPASYLHEAFGLPVAAENDANALAVGEKHFGAAKALSDFVCVTLGTGVGGGCYIGGQLQRGSHFFGNAFGHMPIETGGLPCTCGLSGCLEPYANSSALLRYAAAGSFTSADKVIAAANVGDTIAQGAIRTLAGYLAIACASIVALLDPQMLILAGGLAQDNPLLLKALTEELAKRVVLWPQRKLRVHASALGYSAGVVGAAAVALDALLTAIDKAAGCV